MRRHGDAGQIQDAGDNDSEKRCKDHQNDHCRDGGDTPFHQDRDDPLERNVDIANGRISVCHGSLPPYGLRVADASQHSVIRL